MYRILWHNKTTGGKGQGDILYTSRWQAHELARQADKDQHFEIIHMVRAEGNS